LRREAEFIANLSPSAVSMRLVNGVLSFLPIHAARIDVGTVRAGRVRLCIRKL
jgi:hypothetical protein